MEIHQWKSYNYNCFKNVLLPNCISFVQWHNNHLEGVSVAESDGVIFGNTRRGPYGQNEAFLVVVARVRHAIVRHQERRRIKASYIYSLLTYFESVHLQHVTCACFNINMPVFFTHFNYVLGTYILLRCRKCCESHPRRTRWGPKASVSGPRWPSGWSPKCLECSSWSRCAPPCWVTSRTS